LLPPVPPELAGGVVPPELCGGFDPPELPPTTLAPPLLLTAPAVFPAGTGTSTPASMAEDDELD
jgi:hypothetical protein